MQFEARRIRRHAGAVLALTLAFAFAFTGVAAAQGTQTGTLIGDVKSADGAGLPGVTVTLKSPALQGERTAVTDSTGGFIFRGLPPGQYTVNFALTGFGTVDRKFEVALGGTAEQHPTMAVANVQESVDVTAEAPSILTTTQIGANLKADDVDKLASARTLQGIATLAPGLSDGFRTPNAGQLSIAGAFAYDNVFLINGVDINDNLFGNANNLFIEDAIQEVQVLTNGVSAEYGRFSGGVINAVTKRGGNKFSGSLRMDFTNPAWQDETRFEKDQIAKGVAGAKPHVSKVSHPYQATLGGPILKDRLWFFGAARREKSTEARTLAVTGIGYDFGTINNRYEGKLTGSITPNHTLQADYIRNPVANNGLASINTTFSIDTRTLIDRQNPNDLFVANYNGVLTSNFFVEAQYSRKKFGFRNSGSSFTDIHDSPFLAQGRTGIGANSHYNAPYFDNADPEDRNNQQYTASLSYFLSTGSAGRHDLKFGGERYTSTRTGGNSQSSTNYVFQTDPKLVGGVPVTDASGKYIPIFTPGVSRIQNWLPVRGAQVDLQTLSFYVNDRWQLARRWTFNLGARYEKYNPDTTQAGIQTPRSSALVPRLGATFDVKGDGKWILSATYGHYAGKQSETQFADNTNVGNPNLIVLQYAGPLGEGVNFAPGFDLSNYTVIGGSFPVNNVFLDSGLKTPITKEWTAQAGSRLGRRGEVKVVYAHRKTTNFLDDFITIDRGKTTVTQNGRTFGTFDNAFITNTDIPERGYQALDGIFNYRVTDKWTVAVNYTHQFKNDGNFSGEAANQPGNYSIIGDRPEFYTEARHYPVGHLDQYEANRVRAFTTYDVGFGAFGRASLGVLYRYDSPGAFSFIANNVPVSAIQKAKDPGYASPPTLNTNLFFVGRGTGRYEASHLVDFALTYEVPVWKTARPYFKAEARNAFNAQPLIQYNTTISVDPNSPLDSLGLPTGYITGPNFGKDTSNAHTPIPREFRMSVGFRF
jgi:outer membrane receptor protein involved in Fe transport